MDDGNKSSTEVVNEDDPLQLLQDSDSSSSSSSTASSIKVVPEPTHYISWVDVQALYSGC